MQLIRSFEKEGLAPVGLGLRVMLITKDGSDGHGSDGLLMRRLAGLGGQVECQADLFAGLGRLLDDSLRFGLIVVDCDAFGGLDAVRRACMALGAEAARVPVILVSRDCATQIFPTDRCEAVVLREPVSAVSLRVGFAHALRDRLALRAS
jgi:hypothetical protein